MTAWFQLLRFNLFGVLLLSSAIHSSISSANDNQFFNAHNWNKIPQPIRQRKSSVFLLHNIERFRHRQGSAVLIKKENDVCYFLTNKHVADSLCTKSEHCPPLGVCIHQRPKSCSKNAFAAQNVSLRSEILANGQDLNLKSVTPQFKGHPTYAASGLYQISYDKTHDISLLATKNKKLCAKNSPVEPAPIVHSCRGSTNQRSKNKKLYALGFPGRKTTNGKHQITNLIWGSGYPGNIVSYETEGIKGRVGRGATVPNLPGISGGPVFNTRGELVHLSAAGSSIKESILVDCETMKRFLNHSFSKPEKHYYMGGRPNNFLFRDRQAIQKLETADTDSQKSTFELRMERMEMERERRRSPEQRELDKLFEKSTTSR